MVTVYGMSDKLGPISIDDSSHSVFIGRDFSQTKSYSEKTAALIDDEVKRIFDEAMELCEKILTEHKDMLIRTAEYLLEHETMEGADFIYMCSHDGELPPAPLPPAEEKPAEEPEQLPAEEPDGDPEDGDPETREAPDDVPEDVPADEPDDT